MTRLEWQEIRSRPLEALKVWMLGYWTRMLCVSKREWGYKIRGRGIYKQF